MAGEKLKRHDTLPKDYMVTGAPCMETTEEGKVKRLVALLHKLRNSAFVKLLQKESMRTAMIVIIPVRKLRGNY